MNNNNTGLHDEVTEHEYVTLLQKTAKDEMEAQLHSRYQTANRNSLQCSGFSSHVLGK